MAPAPVPGPAYAPSSWPAGYTPPFPEPQSGPSFAAVALDSHGTRVLIVTFVLIVFLAVIGGVMTALLGIQDTLFRDAIRIVGIGGPASTSADSIAGAVGRRFAQSGGTK